MAEAEVIMEEEEVGVVVIRVFSAHSQQNQQQGAHRHPPRLVTRSVVFYQVSQVSSLVTVESS
jgi:hypothetical protein